MDRNEPWRRDCGDASFPSMGWRRPASHGVRRFGDDRGYVTHGDRHDHRVVLLGQQAQLLDVLLGDRATARPPPGVSTASEGAWGACRARWPSCGTSRVAGSSPARHRAPRPRSRVRRRQLPPPARADHGGSDPAVRLPNSPRSLDSRPRAPPVPWSRPLAPRVPPACTAGPLHRRM